MKIIKHTFILSALSLLSLNSFAQESTTPPETQGGTATGTLDISIKVPKLCDISTASAKAIGQEYVKSIVTVYFDVAVNCKSGVAMKMGFDYGSNPNSTKTTRRLPLNGEQGDATHYLTYQINYRATNAIIGDISEPYEYSSPSYLGNLQFSVIFHANQTDKVIGDYSDTINYQIDYY